jgi:hypothetical protein
LSRRLVSPESVEGGSETQAEARHHGNRRSDFVRLACQAEKLAEYALVYSVCEFLTHFVEQVEFLGASGLTLLGTI